MPRDRDFTSILPNCTVPVMIEAAWQDKFFNADGWMLNIDKITAPMTSYLGAVQGHGADHSPSEDIWHMDWFNKWFFQWLWGMNTTILDEAKYQYASTHFPVVNNYFSFTHDSSTTLLRNASSPLKLYLNKNQRLRTTVQTGSDVISNRVSNGYTLTQAVNAEFTGSNFNSKFKIDSSKFLSDALTTDLQWTGAPVIKVDYKSTAQTFCQLNYQIYEVLPSGERRFVNRANFTDRNYSKGSRRQATFRGQAHSHLFKAGSKILLIITNFDRAHTDAVFFETNPFVLPTMKNGDHTVYFNSNSYIELPIINTSAAPNMSVFAEEESIINNEPHKFSLSQNYPNPFNPSTMIEYTIAKNEQVQLKVFDLLGREVATLVNNMQVPGSYNVNFNAQNLSSGIYFYRISTASFTDVKRMVLVK
jgi:predicted acyl esterase